MIHASAQIKTNFAPDFDPPKWLTIDALESAKPVEHFGYRQMWPVRQWEIVSAKFCPAQPTRGARNACTLWEDYLRAFTGALPQNHSTFKLNADGRTLYVMFSDGFVFMGETAEPDKFAL